MWTKGLILLILALTPQAIIGVEERSLEVVYEWKQLVYGFPTEQDRQDALANGTLVEGTGVPIDVAPTSSRVFITIPRFEPGVPYTLATVSNTTEDDGPVVEPYPSYSWHNANGGDCNRITSAWRVAITECNQMFVIDSGEVGTTQYCPPQLLIFDLNNDTLLHRYKFDESLYTPSASLFITPLVVVDDPPPTGSCQSYHVYFADVRYHGLVVYDSASDSAWRAENRFMYPHPEHGIHTIANESFQLMDGMFALSADDSQLYFHPLASGSEYAISLSALNNRTIWDADADSIPDEFQLIANRSSGCGAEAIDSQSNLYCVSFNPIALSLLPLKNDAVSEIAVSVEESLLEFVSGIKVFNGTGEEELWMNSNRFQKFMAGTMSASEVNYRIVKRQVDDIQAQYN
ncbi:protein yellow-like [Rhagoletis pomonella]|uniref:protein yellow-like n=1 Tax=Rhagoletis pomonella TaxID=28610 RepID=UPI00177F938F|nr:protein yellow-like [Rhagoletis pomonella]